MDTKYVGRVLWRVIAVVAAACLAMPLSASTFIRAGLEELTAGNRMVLVGEVLDVHSYWNADGTFILTDVRIAPFHVAKGKAPEREVVVTILGGTVGDLTTLILDGAEFVTGRSYVVFLDRGNLPGAQGSLTVRDHSQGVFDIVDTEDGLRAVSQVKMNLIPDARGLRQPPGGAKGLPLEELLSSVRSFAGGREAQ